MNPPAPLEVRDVERVLALRQSVLDHGPEVANERGGWRSHPHLSFAKRNPLGLQILPICSGYAPGPSKNSIKPMLWIDIWPQNCDFRSNLIAKIDSAGRVLFVAPGKWSKTSKIINLHQCFKKINIFLCYSSLFVAF